MQVKTCPATIKAAGTADGTEEGVFEAIVATYDVDSVGDRIIPGAFKASLEQWKASGRPIPVIWSHKSDDPEYHVGYVEDAEEREGVGLWVKGRMDLDEPKGLKVYKLMKGRRVTNFSFAYDEIDARPIQKSADGATKELHELKVYEVGPCLIGANQATSLVDVKNQQPDLVGEKVRITDQGEIIITPAAAAPAEKAGRVLSKQNEDRIAQIAALAHELLSSVQTTDQADPSTSNAEKATPAPPADTSAPADAPAGAKDVEPARPGTASERLRTDLTIASLEAEVDSYTI